MHAGLQALYADTNDKGVSKQRHTPKAPGDFR